MPSYPMTSTAVVVDRAQFRDQDDQSHDDQATMEPSNGSINTYTTCDPHHHIQLSSMAVFNAPHRSISFVVNSVLHYASSSVSSLMGRALSLSRQALSAAIYTPLRILPNRIGSAICRIGVVRDYCFGGSRCSSRNMDNCLKDELLQSLDHVERQLVMGQCDFVQALQMLDSLLIDRRFRPYAPLIDQMIFLTACEARSFYRDLCTVSQQLLLHNMPIVVHAVKDTFEQNISNDITRYGAGLAHLWKYTCMRDCSRQLRKGGDKSEKDVVRRMGHIWQQLLSDLPQLGNCIGEILSVTGQSSIFCDPASLNSVQIGQRQYQHRPVDDDLIDLQTSAGGDLLERLIPDIISSLGVSSLEGYTQMLSSKITSWIDKIESIVTEICGSDDDLHDMDRYMAGNLLWLAVLLKRATASTTRSEMEIELHRYCMHMLQNDFYRPFLRSSIQARILFLLSQTVSVQAVSLRYSYIALALEQHPQFVYAKELYDHVQKSRFHRDVREHCPRSIFYARMIGIDYSRPIRVQPIGGWKRSIENALIERMHCNLSRGFESAALNQLVLALECVRLRHRNKNDNQSHTLNTISVIVSQAVDSGLSYSYTKALVAYYAMRWHDFDGASAILDEMKWQSHYPISRDSHYMMKSYLSSITSSAQLYSELNPWCDRTQDVVSQVTRPEQWSQYYCALERVNLSTRTIHNTDEWSSLVDVIHFSYGQVTAGTGHRIPLRTLQNFKKTLLQFTADPVRSIIYTATCNGAGCLEMLLLFHMLGTTHFLRLVSAPVLMTHLYRVQREIDDKQRGREELLVDRVISLLQFFSENDHMLC